MKLYRLTVDYDSNMPYAPSRQLLTTVQVPNRVTHEDALEILKAAHSGAKRWEVEIVTRCCN